jgi:capsular polysaccharide biosynthesis protein
MDGITSLPSDLLAARDEGRYHLTISDEPEFFSGDYYLIGSIHSHFGHFMLEGLSRLWAATLLPAHIFSQLRFVVYEPAISPYAMTCMQLFGIRKEQLIFCPPHAVFDRLFVPAPSYRSHWWAQPEQVRTWDRIAERATAERQHPYPEKVFFSRRNIKERRLSNIDDVEDAFAHAGYAIVAPETFPIGDQIRMAYSAKALAGCVGSAMYLAAFQKKAEIPTIIVGPRSFYLKDDSIIADIKGNNLVVALGTETSESEEKLWYADVGSIRSAIDHTR